MPYRPLRNVQFQGTKGKSQWRLCRNRKTTQLVVEEEQRREERVSDVWTGKSGPRGREKLRYRTKHQGDTRGFPAVSSEDLGIDRTS